MKWFYAQFGNLFNFDFVAEINNFLFAEPLAFENARFLASEKLHLFTACSFTSASLKKNSKIKMFSGFLG